MSLVEFLTLGITLQIPQLDTDRNAFLESRSNVFHVYNTNISKIVILAEHISRIAPHEVDAYQVLAPDSLPAVLAQILHLRDLELAEWPPKEISRELDALVVVHALPHRQRSLEIVKGTEEVGADCDIVRCNERLHRIGALRHLVASRAEVGRQDVPYVLHAALLDGLAVRAIAFRDDRRHDGFEFFSEFHVSAPDDAPLEIEDDDAALN
jgi:hypothetical protein